MVTFHALANLFESISLAQKNQQKLNFISKFLETYYKGAKALEIYGLFRLILPQLDRERPNYGLKEKTLAKLFSDALMLPPSEADRLKHFKNPTKQPEGSPVGEFTQVLISIAKNRVKHTKSSFTVQELNQKLDLLP